MGTVDKSKKPAHQDWHPADIVAAVRKAGWSLRRLSLSHNYAAQSLQAALQRPWPRAERLIATAINVPPHAIWPSRYHQDGRPKSGRNERGIGRLGRTRRKSSTRGARRNVYQKGVI